MLIFYLFQFQGIFGKFYFYIASHQKSPEKENANHRQALFSDFPLGCNQVREIGVYYPLQSKLAVYPFTWVKPLDI